jgi:hypothetical protein
MLLLDFSIDLILPAALGLGSTQPLTEMSTRNLLGGKGRPAREADKLTAVSEPTVENVGTSISHNPTGLQGLLRGKLYLLLIIPDFHDSKASSILIFTLDLVIYFQGKKDTIDCKTHL